MILSLLYIFTTYFKGGLVANAVLILFVIADIVFAEILNDYISQ